MNAIILQFRRGHSVEIQSVIDLFTFANARAHTGDVRRKFIQLQTENVKTEEWPFRNRKRHRRARARATFHHAGISSLACLLFKFGQQRTNECVKEFLSCLNGPANWHWLRNSWRRSFVAFRFTEERFVISRNSGGLKALDGIQSRTLVSLFFKLHRFSNSNKRQIRFIYIFVNSFISRQLKKYSL